MLVFAVIRETCRPVPKVGSIMSEEVRSHYAELIKVFIQWCSPRSNASVSHGSKYVYFMLVKSWLGHAQPKDALTGTNSKTILVRLNQNTKNTCHVDVDPFRF